MDATVRVGDVTYNVTTTESTVVLEVVTPTTRIKSHLPQSPGRALASAIMGAAAELPKQHSHPKGGAL